MILMRPAYRKTDGNWAPTGHTIDYPVYYYGKNRKDAVSRMLNQNTPDDMVEFIEQVAWVNTGYFSTSTHMIVHSDNQSKEFMVERERRDDRYRVVHGDEPVLESRKKVVEQLSSEIIHWLKSRRDYIDYT